MEAKWANFPINNEKRSDYFQLKKKLKRPQEPLRPLPYEEKEVSFVNTQDNIKLVGTLSMPKNPSAAAILISGSGPQDRDQLFMGHKTFLVLADHLARKGVAVLRYDDRGVGKSQGVFEGSTSYDFARDASAAINFLQQLPTLAGLNIGAIGHSEGGLIAPVLASGNDNVDFIVLMAGPSQTGKFVSENQMKKILLSNGVSLATAVAGSKVTKHLNNAVLQHQTLPTEQLKQTLKSVYQAQWQIMPEEAQKQLRSLGGGTLTQGRLNMLTGNWYKTFLTHDPVEYLKDLKIPIFALFADKDVQVSANEHFALMKTTVTLAANPASKVQVMADQNHLFQPSKTGSMSEYQHIQQTLSLVTLRRIEQWIIELEN